MRVTAYGCSEWNHSLSVFIFASNLGVISNKEPSLCGGEWSLCPHACRRKPHTCPHIALAINQAGPGWAD